MCGVVAIVGSAAATAPIEAALDALTHRGPDGRGIWRGEGIVLGHTRLEIRERGGGHQPVHLPEAGLSAVVNGELYGPLRSRLRDLGHAVPERADSPLVLHAYREYGDACLAHFAGELAFCLWDAPRRRLLVGRDRFGIKPLFYARLEDGFAFASEAKALFALGVPAQWDLDAWAHVARHQYLPPERSYFEGVSMLPPGSRGVFEQGRLRIERYWSPPEETLYIARPEAAEQLRARLGEAVQRRLEADVPVAFSLSGGLDSSAALALAGPGQAAFSIRFEGDGYDEHAHAAHAAAALQADLTFVDASRARMWRALPDAVHAAEGLAINGQLPAKYLLAQAIRASGAKVVISGEGADEALLGYPHLFEDFAGRTSDARSHDAGASALMLPQQNLHAPIVQAALGGVPSFLSAKAGLGGLLTDLFRPELRPKQDALHNLSGELEHCARAPNFVRQSAQLWSRLALAGYILRTLADGTEMAHGVEGRPPFLDHEVFEFAWRLPPDVCFDGPLEKAPLRQAMEGYLPEALRLRRKHPLVAPPLGDPDAEVWPQMRAQLEGACPSPFAPEKVRGFLDRFERLPPPARAREDAALVLLLSASILEARLRLTCPA